MDRLAMDAMLARQEKMSYGKWKAMQQPVKEKKSSPEDWRKCEYCGKPFKKKFSKKFCDTECRENFHREEYNAYKREYIKKRREQIKKGELK